MDSEILKRRSKNLSYEVTSLAKCEDEPIAFIGAIQPAGLLIVADRQTLAIRAISANFPGGTEKIFGQPLSSLVIIDDKQELAADHLCALISADKIKPRLRSNPSVVYHACSCRVMGKSIVIEFELAPPAVQVYPVAGLRDLVQSLKPAESIREACQHTAEAIKALSGFDRVMIYRFDPNWNGDVIAEARNESLEPFLDLRYPASDIPPQARELFFRNHSRMIVDVQAEPVPILTSEFHPGEIDLSATLLRAVSPIHIQYLTNMGVSASFSAPIRVNDKLWGLIACHHYSGPMHATPETRSAFELAGQIVSGKINDLVSRRRLQIKNETLLFTHNLLTQVAAGNDSVESFGASADAMLRLTESTGAYVKIGNREAVLGQAPRAGTIEKLRAALAKVGTLTAWSSDSLVRDCQIEPDPNAAGALAVPFSLGFDDTLIWFRPEEVQEVRWGGKPKENVPFNPQSIERLIPRLSFAEWREKLANHSRPWSEANEECAQFFLFGFVQGIFAKAQALSLAYSELERTAKAKDEFISMVSHELRTPLGIIIGWIEILKEYPQSAPEAQDAVEIIDRNAKMQIGLINDLLDVSRIIAGKLRLDPQPNVDLKTLLSDVVDSLRPTAAMKQISLTLLTPPVVKATVDPDRLRQMVWNLITNAIKFTPKEGRVMVSALLHRSSIEIVVEDTGIGIDPSKIGAIFDRFVQVGAGDAKLGGLGLGLSIVKALAELHGGWVEAHSAGPNKGSLFTITLPVQALRMEPETRQAPAVSSRSAKLSGLKILVAEDQADSLRALTILLERNGAIPTGAPDGEAALAALKADRYDLILSDIGMPQMDGYDLIRAWRQEEQRFKIPHIPAIALTAYASSKDRTKALAAGFQSHIPKPVDRDELMAVIDSIGLLKK